MKSIDSAELKFQILSVLKESKSGLTPKDLTDRLADIFGLTKEEREEFHSTPPDSLPSTWCLSSPRSYRSADLLSSGHQADRWRLRPRHFNRA